MSDLPACHRATPSGLLRARALGVPFRGTPGSLNALTDVAGLEVGHRTLIHGDGALSVGHGPVRTGVTVIHPRGRSAPGRPVFAGVHSMNGNGEMTGFVWIEEAGRTELPIVLTNTHSVGLARDAVVRWMVRTGAKRMSPWMLPVAAETYDGHLNDIDGFHITDADVFAALDDARTGPLEEGSVGGGTGMVCYEWKGGIGTASRAVTIGSTPGIVGALVQANFGRRAQFHVAGMPVGRWLLEGAPGLPEQGSIIVVVATDLPLMPHQLRRVAKRATLGVGRSGAIAGHGSGDIFLAFSTANADFFDEGADPRSCLALPDDALNPIFEAVIQSVDEAILNALVANTTMVGRDGHRIESMPHEPIQRWCRALSRGELQGDVGG
ncbi:MAG: P1 family peptidase [Deltaproteobacteria bacterium]|nr:P1 family peptidase [Deltaproteobacteria bacterium]